MTKAQFHSIMGALWTNAAMQAPSVKAMRYLGAFSVASLVLAAICGLCKR